MQWVASHFSFLLHFNHVRRHILWSCNLFQKGQIIGMHQTKKISKELAETTKIGLRTVQRIMKNWKDSGEQSSSRKKCDCKNILNDHDWRSLKCLVKSNSKRTTVELSCYSVHGLLSALQSCHISLLWHSSGCSFWVSLPSCLAHELSSR